MSIGQHPRKHESPARAAQLERLKLERQARRETRRSTRQPKRTVGSFAPIGDDAPAGPTYAQALAELRRIAMGGVMPTPARYDFAKPVMWPTADALCARWGLSWEQLADEVGLRVRKVSR